MMMKIKTKTRFRCQECGYETAKWLGRCPDCGTWNALHEEHVVGSGGSAERRRLTEFSSPVTPLSAIKPVHDERITTQITEFDRLLGNGIVPGSVVLLGGPPGIGKSTLMLHVSAHIAHHIPVLYITGEESIDQVKARADRLSVNAPNMYVLAETRISTILEAIKRVKPRMVVVDSIQTMYRQDIMSAPGTVGQIRECTAELLNAAKATNTAVFVLGHVTKEGDIAGPRVLEHIVDAVLYFEEEKHNALRILRALKNRFGPTNEIGIFEMRSTGLMPIGAPQDLFLSSSRVVGPGTTVVATVEGSRPLLLEIQALVSRSHFGFPKRQVNGIDYNRFLLLIAVLEKRLNLHLENEDIFLNVAGGIRIKETAVDLGICAAVASAFSNITVDKRTLLLGEVGLSGEIRTVPQISARLAEAQRLG
ncbi:MAG: DNA repair protein RadA, partial [Elusimicrobia bacterium]|nr:DNA repair protein RadA [Elusimicrobiota bacterium]